MSATVRIFLVILAVLWMPVTGHGQAAGEKAPSQNEARHPDFAPREALIEQWSEHGAGQSGTATFSGPTESGWGGRSSSWKTRRYTRRRRRNRRARGTLIIRSSDTIG